MSCFNIEGQLMTTRHGKGMVVWSACSSWFTERKETKRQIDTSTPFLRSIESRTERCLEEKEEGERNRMRCIRKGALKGYGTSMCQEKKKKGLEGE